MPNQTTNQTPVAGSTSTATQTRFLQQRLAQTQDNLNDLPDNREELMAEMQLEVQLIGELLTELDGSKASLTGLLRGRLQEAEKQLAARPDKDKIGYDEAYLQLAYEREALGNIFTAWEESNHASS
jgi:hypothetical protein